jgi:hypothetical protein
MQYVSWPHGWWSSNVGGRNHGDGDVMLGVALLILLPFSCTLAGGCDDLCCSCVVISDAKISRGLGLLIW